MTAAEQTAATKLYTTSQVLALTGVKWRFLDHACRAGYLPAPDKRVERFPGSGQRRMFTANEVDVLYLVRHLVDAGFRVEAAFTIARVVVGRIYELIVRVANPTEPPKEHTP